MAKLTLRPEMVKPFNGTGDVEAWLSKVELVAKLTQVEDLASFVPLFLEEGALAMYLEMKDKEKGDIEFIKLRLREAFSDNQFRAYSKLRELKWAGEAVDVFANELRRLAKLCGLRGEGLEQVVKLGFVMGFPDSISVELQQIVDVERMRVSDLIGRARVLAANKGSTSHSLGLAAAVDRTDPPQKETVNTSRKPVKCFNCGGPHFVRDCAEKKRQVICFRCGGAGHISSRCEKPPKENSGDNACASMVTERSESSKSGCAKGVPVIRVCVNGKICSALVDTGCSNSLIRSGLVDQWTGEVHTQAFDGRSVKCMGTSNVHLEVAGEKMRIEATVIDGIVGNIDFVLGMDVIDRLGGVMVGEKTVQFGRVACLVTDRAKPHCLEQQQGLYVQDRDFEAKFDGKVWTVRYFWKEHQEPQLTNRVALYDRDMTGVKRERFDAEVQKWIAEGILVPWEGEVGGIIPLMAVEQPTKGKVRPVLDFRELNEYVECHTGDELIDVCDDRLREWRRVEGEPELVDLSGAYLQLRVCPELWKYQLVQYDGKVYCLTRLGFGLNSAPRIMTKVLKTVLSQERKIEEATSSYIDDILVDVSKVGSDEVISHLGEYGLLAKPAARLDGGTALGLKLTRAPDGRLAFERNADLPLVDHKLSKRELFSVCGKLVGHYPVVGWLRIACSFVKRHSEGSKWNDYIGDRAQFMIEDLVERVRTNDPVGGRWCVDKARTGKIWCDASSLAMGVVVEIGGVTVEDGAWMRKADDYHHINVAELEAVLKGINLGIKWGLQDMVVMTDSATVYGWIKLTMSEERRIKTSGAAEILVRRRLATLRALMDEVGFSLRVSLVPSKDNKADVMTRVKKEWLSAATTCQTACASLNAVREMHNQHHMGVERTLFLARQIDPSVTKHDVKSVVKSCERCRSVDPAPVRHEQGRLDVESPWHRLAVDVTHYQGVPYLTMVDCGPGRFAIWRQLKSETTQCIITEMKQIFFERGPVSEVLLDNATVFRSQLFTEFMATWNIQVFYRAAYRPSGNGIVERNHRTIKAMAERGGFSPIEAVFYYNSAPRYGQQEDSIPQRAVLAYDWRQPAVVPEKLPCDSDLSVPVVEGDEVWVKPPNSRCTTQWSRGVVTKVNSNNNVEVDQVPRHILDVRRVEDSTRDDDAGLNELNEVPEVVRPQRERRAPLWMDDYVTDTH